MLTSSTQKERFRDLKWPYRFVKAYKDPEFWEPVFRKSMGRLDTILSQQLSFTVTVDGTKHTLGADQPVEFRDLFSRDLSQALLLGWHINYPFPVWGPEHEDWFDSDPPETLSGDRSPKRKTHVIEKLQNWGITSAADLPLPRNQELRLVVLLLRARMDSRMTDPAGRAGKILRYASRDLIEEIVETMGFSKGEDEDQVDFIRDGFDEELYRVEARDDEGNVTRATSAWDGWYRGRRPEDPDQNVVLDDFEPESGSE